MQKRTGYPCHPPPQFQFEGGGNSKHGLPNRRSTVVQTELDLMQGLFTANALDISQAAKQAKKLTQMLALEPQQRPPNIHTSNLQAALVGWFQSQPCICPTQFNRASHAARNLPTLTLLLGYLSPSQSQITNNRPTGHQNRIADTACRFQTRTRTHTHTNIDMNPSTPEASQRTGLCSKLNLTKPTEFHLVPTLFKHPVAKKMCKTSL